GRPATHRLALLHQRRGDEFYAGGRMSGFRMELREPLSRGERGVPENHPPVRSGRIGVLIVSLGTPEGTDYWSMRRYLREFLSDRRVIEAPRAVWLPILEVILLRRPSARGRDY